MWGTYENNVISKLFVHDVIETICNYMIGSIK